MADALPVPHCSQGERGTELLAGAALQATACIAQAARCRPRQGRPVARSMSCPHLAPAHPRSAPSNRLRAGRVQAPGQVSRLRWPEQEVAGQRSTRRAHSITGQRTSASGRDTALVGGSHRDPGPAVVAGLGHRLGRPGGGAEAVGCSGGVHEAGLFCTHCRLLDVGLHDALRAAEQPAAQRAPCDTTGGTASHAEA